MRKRIRMHVRNCVYRIKYAFQKAFRAYNTYHCLVEYSPKYGECDSYFEEPHSRDNPFKSDIFHVI